MELRWTSIADLDFHLTGPTGVANNRFHVSFASTGNFGAAPFAALSNDKTGIGGSETLVINGFNQGDLYRASVFNFGNQAANGTSLAQLSNATVRVIINGSLTQTATGGVINGGSVLATYTVPTTGVGNTWNVLTINPATRVVTPLNTVNSSGIP